MKIKWRVFSRERKIHGHIMSYINARETEDCFEEGLVLFDALWPSTKGRERPLILADFNGSFQGYSFPKSRGGSMKGLSLQLQMRFRLRETLGLQTDSCLKSAGSDTTF